MWCRPSCTQHKPLCTYYSFVIHLSDRNGGAFQLFMKSVVENCFSAYQPPEDFESLFILLLCVQAPSVSICPEARFVMLRYLTHVEVWQLGSTAPITNGDAVHEGILPLIADPLRLLSLKSRGGDVIVCADMSSNGKWIAYSSLRTTSFFRFHCVSLHISVGYIQACAKYSFLFL